MIIEDDEVPEANTNNIIEEKKFEISKKSNLKKNKNLLPTTQILKFFKMFLKMRK
jgi:hypothetical protein